MRIRQNIDLNNNSIFRVNGKQYLMLAVAIAFDENDPSNLEKQIKIPISNTYINYFSWVNEINNILLTGNLEFLDIDGSMGAIFSSYSSFLKISISEIEDENKTNAPNVSVKEIFEHTFLINSFEIKSRAENGIVYNLYLVSKNWFNYVANIEYSTYNSKETTKSVYSIMKDILEIAFSGNNTKQICDNSFNKECPVMINYCTTCQTTCVDAIKYLQNKLIYLPETTIDNLSFLVYDEFNNIIKLFSLNLQDINNNNILISKKMSTIFSSFGSDIEQFVQKGFQNLLSVNKKTNCQGIKSLFSKELFSYDFNLNAISPDDDLTSDKICNIGITNNSLNSNENAIFNLDKFSDILGMTTTAEKHYKNIGTTDNNNFSIYDDLIKNITDRNSLILETSGEIRNQPGQLFNIIDDINYDSIKDKSIISKLKTKNKMLIGIFYIFKTRHTIIPGSPDDSAFTERLFLARTTAPKLN